MKFAITIDSDNDACSTATDIVKMLGQVSKKVTSGHTGGKVMDANGNSVGTWEIGKSSPSVAPITLSTSEKKEVGEMIDTLKAKVVFMVAKRYPGNTMRQCMEIASAVFQNIMKGGEGQ